MKAVITGSTGLIGSLLVSRLLDKGGWEITALYRSESSLGKLSHTLTEHGHALSDVETLRVNMFDYQELLAAFPGADVVFHTAAVVDLSGRDVVAENVELTELVVQACLSTTPQPVLIHISSIAALPETIQSLPDASPYARSKFLSENQIWKAAKLGLRVGVVAPAIVLGVGAPGSGGLQPVITRAQKGLPFYTDGATGFVDVRDVAEAMITIAENPALQGGKRYVLCSANLNYRDFITLICQQCGKHRPWIKVTPWMFRVVTFLLRVMPNPLLTNEMGSFLFSRNTYDGSALERESSGFQYHTIQDTIKYIVAKSNAR